eukprot:1192042-Prorocentrum_minimum.AAC.2
MAGVGSSAPVTSVARTCAIEWQGVKRGSEGVSGGAQWGSESYSELSGGDPQGVSYCTTGPRKEARV